MRSRLLSNAWKWLGSQGTRGFTDSSPGFGGSAWAGYRQTPVAPAGREQNLCNGCRTVYPLFSRAFCPAAYESDVVQPVQESGKDKNSQKKLFWKVYFKGDGVPVLERWLNDGNKLTARDLQSIVRSLREYRAYHKALKVSEWMPKNNKFEFTAGDYAIQLDLTAKVHGVDSAEKYFTDLPEFAKNECTYCTLLHCYVNERSTKKAEQCMEKIKELGFAKTALPYNTIMDLYMGNGQVEKVLLMIKQLKKMNVELDSFTYTLWINACADMSGFDDVEKIVDEIKARKDDNVSWTIYNTLANIYIKAGLVDKVESALKELERNITKNDRIAYDYLITTYASLGNKEEVHRIWQSLKTNFKKLNDQNYKCALAALVKVGDIGGAEKILGEWEYSTSRYDCKVSNTLLAAYVRKGMLEKAEIFHDHVIKKGGVPNCKTWEILTEKYLQSKEMDKAVITMRRALSKVKSSEWQPRSENVIAILKYFEKHGNLECAEEFLKLLRRIKCVTTEIYNSLLLIYAKDGKAAPKILRHMVVDNVSADEETDRLLKLINDKLQVKLQ